MRPDSLPRAALAAAALTVLAAGAFTSPSVVAGDSTPAALLGKQVPDFSLTDFDGKSHTLAQYRDRKATVLIFVSTKCPVSNAYNERMVALAAEYQPKGIQFLGVNSNKAEDVAEMASHAKSNSWNFPVLKDTGNTVADKLGASVTPEVYLLDAKGTLRYHGRIDDSQDPAGITQRDLKSALDSLLSGSDIAKKESKAFGCSIKRVEAKQGL